MLFVIAEHETRPRLLKSWETGCGLLGGSAENPLTLFVIAFSRHYLRRV
jgi:hypothetical protein